MSLGLLVCRLVDEILHEFRVRLQGGSNIRSPVIDIIVPFGHANREYINHGVGPPKTPQFFPCVFGASLLERNTIVLLSFRTQSESPPFHCYYMQLRRFAFPMWNDGNADR